MKGLIVIIIVQNFANKAQAFNPAAFIAGVQAVSGILQHKSEFEEMAGLGIELVSLLEDLDVDDSSEQDVNQAVQKLQELDHQLMKMRSVHSEITSSMKDEIRRANTLKEQIRTLKAMIGKTKRIADLMSQTPKAGAAAADVQSIQLNTMILNELQTSRRARDLVQIEKAQSRAERYIYMDELRREYEGSAR